jgi:hypothetical protein
MEDNSLPPSRLVHPSGATGSLDVTDLEAPVSQYSIVQKNYPIETLEVRGEADSAAEAAAAASIRSLPFSRRRATIVSVCITALVLLVTIASAGFFVNKDESKQSDLKQQVPAQDVTFDSAAEITQPPELEGEKEALLVNGSVIARGDLKVVSNGFVSTLHTQALTTDQVLTLPNASGTICLDSNNCKFASQDQVTEQVTINNQQVVQIAQLQSQLNQVVIPPAGVTTLNDQNGAVTVQGTVNQINVSTANGTITLSTPQDLASISSPTFAGLLLNGGLTLTGTITTGLDCSGNLNDGALTANAGGQIVCSNDDGGGGGGAPIGATYLVTALDAALTAERALAAGANIQFTDGGANGSFTIATVQNPAFTTSVTTPLLTSTAAMTITPGGALTVGAVGQTALIQGSTSTITSSAGNDIILNSGDTIELQDSTNITGALAVTGNVTGGTYNGQTINATASFTGTVSVATSVTTPSLILTGAGSNGTLQVANLGQVTTFTLPDPGQATADICLSTGNCVGGGAGGAPNSAAYLTIGNNATLTSERAIAVNATNLSFTDGGANGSYTINTIQNIATTSTPTFAGLTLNGNLSMGANTIQGTTAAIDFTSFDVSSAGAVTAVGVNAGSGLLQGTGGITVAGTVTLSSLTNGFLEVNGSGVVSVGTIDLGTDTNGNYVATIAAGNGISGSSATEGGTPTIALSNLTADWLQSGAFDIVLNNAASELRVLESAGATFFGTVDVGDLSADRTYTFPNATGTVCLDTGNCAGSGGGVTTPGGTTNRVAKFTGAQTIGDSTITDDGTNVSISGDFTIQGGDATLGTAVQAGGLVISDGSSNTGTITTAALGANRAYVLPDASGDFCLSSGNCIGGGSGGAPNAAEYLVVSLNGTLTNERALASGANIAFTDGGANGSFTVATVQNPTFTTSVTTPLLQSTAGMSITPGGALTVGATTQTALLQGSVTTITSTGVGNDIILNSADTIELQDNTNITGTLGVTGAVTAGTYNGQTISSTASFTGTVAVATSVTTPTLASTGALSITPGGALTVGATGQTATLQGSVTTISSNGAGNDIVLTSADQIRLTGFNCTTFSNGGALTTDASGNLACSNDDGGGAAPTFQSVYDGSTPAAFTLNSTNDGLIIHDDATPIGGSLFAVQNNDGSTSYLDVTASGVTITTLTLTNDLTVANGGTGASTFTTNGVLYGNGASAIQATSAPTSGQVLLGNGSGVPTFTTLSGDVTVNGTGVTAIGADAVALGTDTTGNYVATAASGNGISVSGSGSESAAISLALGALTANWDQTGAFDIVLNNASSELRILESAGATFFGTLDVGDLTADRTYTFPDATGTVCLDTGNCAGSGGGVTTAGGTTNRVAKFTGAQTIGDSTITDDGTNVSITGDFTLQGGDITVGTTSQLGSLILHDGNGQTTTVRGGDSVGNLTFILPTAAGATNQCIKQSVTANQLFFDSCDGGAGGSSTTLQQAYANGNTIATSSARDIAFTLSNDATDSNFSVTIADDSTSTVQIVRANGTGTNNPAQLFLLDNLDTNQVIADGLKIQAAGGGITDAIDLSDAELVNALNVGDNTILGTTAVIDFTNFDVLGNGDTTVGGTLAVTGTVTGGTYNGQTISSSASFTGTLNVAGVTTLQSTLAVQGASATIGGAAQQGSLVLNDGNGQTATMSVGSALAANTALAIPTAVGATDTFCLQTLANCVGGSGGAPNTAEYLVVSLNGTLSNERALATGANIAFTDGGANGSFTVATVQNPTFTTSVTTPLLQNAGSLTLGTTATGGADDIIFQTAGTEKMRLLENGNVEFVKEAARTIKIANSTTTDTAGATLSILGADSNGDADGGAITIKAGTSASATEDGGTVTVQGGDSNNNGGNVVVRGGDGTNNGGTLFLRGGDNGSGLDGSVSIQNNQFIVGKAGTVQSTSTVAAATAFSFDATTASANGLSVDVQSSSSSQSALLITSNNGATTGLIVRADGNVGIGTASPDYLFSVGSGSLFGVNSSGGLVFEGATADANEFTIVAADPTADRTYTVPNSSAATDTFCLATLANCAGSGGGVTTPGGTANRVSIFTGAQTIGDSWLLQNTSTLELDNTRNLSLLGGNLSVTGNGTLTGNLQVDGNSTIGNASSDTLSVNAATSFNTDVDAILAETENFTVGNTVTGTNSVSVLNASITNNTSSGTQNLALLQNAGGSGVTDGLLVLDNADTDTAVSGAIVVTSATGGITNGIDVSDSDITNALLFGANDVIGTNFTIAGATGAVTGGTYNGQTISSAASFTGTLSVAGATSLQTTLGVGTAPTTSIITVQSSAGEEEIHFAGDQEVNLIAEGALYLAFDSNNNSGSSEFAIYTDGTTEVLGVSNGGNLRARGSVTSGTTALQGSLILNDGDGQTATISVGSGLVASTALAIPTTVGASDTFCLMTLGNCFGSGTGGTLQAAYNAGNTITTTNARDIDITLADTATDSNFLVDIATGSTGRFAVQGNNTDVLGVTSSAVTVSQALTVNADTNLNGNLTITSLASGSRVITARFNDDFSGTNATTYFQNSGTNENTYLNLVSNGTATTTGIMLQDNALGGQFGVIEHDTTAETLNIRATNVLSNAGATIQLLTKPGSGGADTVRLSVDPNGVTRFNPTGTDSDFSIQGDTDANLFYVDASTDRLGLGTNTPGSRLHIKQSAQNNTQGLRVENSGVGTGFDIRLYYDSGNVPILDMLGDYQIGHIASAARTGQLAAGRTLTVKSFNDSNLGGIIFDVGGTERARFDNNGNLGIGDTSPDARLDVEPTGAVTATSYAQRIENLQTNVTTDAIDKYGLHITSTGSFTGSAGTATNNYGLYIAEPTGGDNNYAINLAGATPANDFLRMNYTQISMKTNAYGKTTTLTNGYDFNINTDEQITLGASNVSGNLARLEVNINDGGNGAAIEVNPQSATQIGTIIRGFASQSADLLQIQNSSSVAMLMVNPSGQFVFEGSTNDANELTIAVADPAADRTYTIPDSTGNSTDTFCLQTLANCSGTSPWTTDSGVVNLVTDGNTVTIGSATAGGKLFVDGDADEIQLQVQANATQTADALVIESSAGSDYLAVQGDGDVAVDTNTLFVDATANRVGIGNAAPSAALEVTGDIYLTKEAARTIKLANSTTAATAGATLNILGADGNGAVGGAINITGGSATGSNFVGGDVAITGGNGVGFTIGGNIDIRGGGSLVGGSVRLNGGDGFGLQGDILLQNEDSNSFVGIGIADSDARLELGGNLSTGAWGLNGAQLQATSATYTDNSTAASGTATNTVFNSFGTPSWGATNATVTTTNAATVYIQGAPALAGGSDDIITNAYSLWVDAGTARFDGTIDAQGGSVTNTAGALSLTSATTNAITLDSGTTGIVNVGTGANAKTVNIGTGAGVANTINIGGSGGNTVAIGNTQSAGSIAMGAAMTTGTVTIGGTGAQTGNIDLGIGTGAQIINLGTGGSGVKTVNLATGTAANVISIGTGQTAGSIAMGTAMTSGTITLGGAVAQTGTIILGQSTGTNTVRIGDGTGATTIQIGTGVTNAKTIQIGTGAAMANAINLGGTGANTIAIGNTQTAGSISLGAAMTTGTISIGGTSGQTGAISLGTGTGAQTINLGTGGTGAKTVTLGSTASTSSTTIQSGTGNLSLNTNGSTQVAITNLGDVQVHTTTTRGIVTINDQASAAINNALALTNTAASNAAVGNSINLDAFNGDGNWRSQARLVSGWENVTGGGKGMLQIYVDNDSSAERFRVQASKTIANPTGEDVDFQVQGDTQANLIYADASTDRVGIGTATPSSTLDVAGAIELDLTASTNNFALCHENNGASNNEVIKDCAGTPSADYMEMYSVANDVETGDVLMPGTEYVTTKNGQRLTKLVKSSGAYQRNVIGIASNPDEAGDFNSVGHNIKDEDHPYPVALNGRVLVKMSQSSPALEPGDYITAADEAGKATKATQPGLAIGKVLESWTPGSGQAMVLTFVSLSWYDPGQNLQGSPNTDQDASFANLNVSGHATLATLTVTGDATIQGELTVSTLHVTDQILVDGHIVTGGDTPAIAAADGQPVTTTVDGTDTAGTITLTSNPGSHAGALAQITFTHAFGKTPRVVLSPTTSAAAGIKVYVEKTAAGFTLHTDDTPAAGQSYNFDYIVIE